MRRLLLLFNLLLLGTAVVLGMKIMETQQQAKLQQERLLALRTAPLDLPIPQLAAPAPTATPGNYLAVAQQLLFSMDRNPNEIIPPAPPPPPPPADPTFPAVHGVMSFMGPVSVIMTHPKEPSQKRYVAGDKIADLTIKALTNREITFATDDGREFTKALAQLANKAPEVAAAGGDASWYKPPETIAVGTQPQQAQTITDQRAPGVEVTDGVRACNPGDDTPAGTVQNGFKKVIRQSGFGTQCAWVPAN